MTHFANWAHDGGNLEHVEFLVGRSATLGGADAWGCTELLEAVFNNAHNTLAYLLRKCVSAHCTFVDGRTIFHIAARNADARTVQILGAERQYILAADPWASNNDGFVAMDYLKQKKDADEFDGVVQCSCGGSPRRQVEDNMGR